MTGKNEKTQPQELLEEVIGITHGDRNEDEKFPTIAEQQEYWKHKEAEKSDQTPFTCTKLNDDGSVCDRTFKSPQAVRMHVARAHDHTILAPKQKKPNQTLMESLVQHPLYDYPPKKGQIQPWDKIKPPPQERIHRKWSLARRRAFNRKKREGMVAISTGPLPSPWREDEPLQEEPVSMIRFCPHCGKGLERFLA